MPDEGGATTDEASIQEQGMPDDRETEAQRKARETRLETSIKFAHRKWKEYADKKIWDQVRAPMEVYRFCGEKLDSDPRQTKEYKAKVLQALCLDTEERGAAKRFRSWVFMITWTDLRT